MQTDTKIILYLTPRNAESGYYTIRVDPNVRPAQHARHNIAIESRAKIEPKLQEKGNFGVSMTETRLTKWVSSLTYPQECDRTLHVCLISWGLNKAILHQYCKASALNKICHCLHNAQLFSTFYARNGF